MKKAVIIILCFWMLVSTTVAQYPRGYETVYSPPVAGMIPLNTYVEMGIFVPTGSYGLECQKFNVRIDAYIVWIYPARPPEYYAKVDERSWVFIWNKETIDAGGCH